MEKIYDIIYSALMAYGEIGIILGIIILVLFIAQIALQLGIYGRVASFRLMSKTKMHSSVNEGLSGGERKKNEIFLLFVLSYSFSTYLWYFYIN